MTRTGPRPANGASLYEFSDRQREYGAILCAFDAPDMLASMMEVESQWDRALAN
jgi:hypothetical protein